jgi:hypothetical protein
MRMRHWMATVLLAGALAGCASPLRAKYDRLIVGMTAKEVIALVGEPKHRSSAGGIWLYTTEGGGEGFTLKVTRGLAGAPLRLLEIGSWMDLH